MKTKHESIIRVRKITPNTISRDKVRDTAVVVVGFLALISLIILAGCQQQAQGNTINVQGSSDLKYKPDQATVFAGVSVLNATAQNAQAKANEITNAIIAGLKQIGIQEADIGTQQLTLNEEFSYTQNGTHSVGWRATQIISVKTQNLAKVGPIVDACVNNGANQVQNINFELSKSKENDYKQTALAEASKNAKAKAEAIANSLNVKLGKIKTASEANAVYLPYGYALKDTMGTGAVSEAAAVVPPELTVSATINVEYYIG